MKPSGQFISHQMTTDEFIVLCDGISCESKLQINSTYEEEQVRIYDRLADASLVWENTLNLMVQMNAVMDTIGVYSLHFHNSAFDCPIQCDCCSKKLLSGTCAL